MGGTNDYCAENCKAINGGTVTKNVFTWFWVRSSLPKRLWKKCMDYQVKKDDGKLISYKLVGHSVIPVEVKMQEEGLNTDFMNIRKKVQTVSHHSNQQELLSACFLVTQQVIYLFRNISFISGPLQERHHTSSRWGK